MERTAGWVSEWIASSAVFGIKIIKKTSSCSALTAPLRGFNLVVVKPLDIVLHLLHNSVVAIGHNLVQQQIRLIHNLGSDERNSFQKKRGTFYRGHFWFRPHILSWCRAFNLEVAWHFAKLLFTSCKPLLISDILARVSRHSVRIWEPMDLLMVAVASWRTFQRGQCREDWFVQNPGIYGCV